MHLNEKLKAVGLRKHGKSYSEIHAFMPNISKGTLSKWLSHVKLTKAQKKNIEANSHEGRLRANRTNRLKKNKRLESYSDYARKLFEHYCSDSFFIAGVVLYWAEGAKTTERVSFMNSDPRLIVLMLNWVKKHLKVPRERMRARLYIHKIYAHENHEKFWKKIISLPKKQFLRTIYKPTPHTVKRNLNYKGCIRIDAGGVKEFHMIKSWQELLTKRYKLAPVVQWITR